MVTSAPRALITAKDNPPTLQHVATRLERAAYRYASITLAIVMLIARANRSWTVALHRFAEVSIGIAIGLVASAIWPERSRES